MVNFSLNMNVKAALAELVAMTIFVYVGCGTAMFFSAPKGFDFSAPNKPSDMLLNPSFGIITALAFGLAITFLAYTVGHISGGHINSAVTWGLFLSGKVSLGQLVLNTFTQAVGATLGAALLYATLPQASASSLGTNGLATGAYPYNALIGEIMMTFTLVFTVLMTTSAGASSSVGAMAPLAIGLSVFAAHAVLIPLDGCSINPMRSFGPALVANEWSDFWIFLIGPYTGSTIAAVVFALFDQSTKIQSSVVSVMRRSKRGHDDGESMKESPSDETLAEQPATLIADDLEMNGVPVTRV